MVRDCELTITRRSVLPQCLCARQKCMWERDRARAHAPERGCAAHPHKQIARCTRSTCHVRATATVSLIAPTTAPSATDWSSTGQTIGDLTWSKFKATCLNGGPAKPFKWFLENVYPELTDVLTMSQTGSTGQIKNPHTGGCIDTMGRHSTGGEVGLYPCHGAHGTQEFLLSKDGQIRVALMDFKSCVGVGEDSYDSYPTITRCFYSEEEAAKGAFDFDHASGRLRHRVAGTCLTALKESRDTSSLSLKYQACSSQNDGQEWRLGGYE